MGEDDRAVLNVTLKETVLASRVSLRVGLARPTNNGVRMTLATGEIVDITQAVDNHVKTARGRF